MWYMFVWRRLVEVGLSLLCVVCVCLTAVGGSRLIPVVCGMCLYGRG